MSLPLLIDLLKIGCPTTNGMIGHPIFTQPI